MQPQRKTDVLIKQFNSREGRLTMSEFQYATFLRDAKNFRDSNPSLSLAHEAIVHLLYGATNHALNCAKKAYSLNSDKNNFGLYYNTLIANGKFEEGAKLSESYFNHNYSDDRIFENILDIGFITLDDKLLTRSIETYTPVSKEQALIAKAKSELDEVEQVLGALKSIDLDKSIFSNMFSIAMNVLHKKFNTRCVHELLVQHTEIGKIIVLDLKVEKASAEDCIELNNDFIDMLIEDDSHPFSDCSKIHLSFIPLVGEVS